MRLTITGPQGARKVPRSTSFSQAVRMPHISTRHLLRRHVADRTEPGRRAHEYVSAGELVPDEVTNAPVADRLSATDDGYVLDGFPRTLDQAHWRSRTAASTVIYRPSSCSTLTDAANPTTQVAITAPNHRFWPRTGWTGT